MDADLLLQHQRSLRRLVRGLVRDEHAAEDLEQSTWLTALSRPPRSSDVLGSWLTRVARNLSRNGRRAEANEAARRRTLAEERSWPPADEIAAELELAERVLAAVRALPEPLRAAVHARYYEGLSLEEIARHSGTPVGTIRDRIERARAILRRELGPIGDEPHGLRGFLLAFFRRTTALLGGILVKKLVAVVAVVLIALLLWHLRAVPATTARTSPAAQAESISALAEPTSELSVAEAKPAERAALAPESQPSVVTTTGSLLVAVKWPDGTPAERVLVRVWQDEDAELTRFARTQATDAAGSARLAELAPGSYHAQLEREKDGTNCVVSAGEETSVALAVSPGPRVEGLVVDEEGTPVAGAGVWISTRGAHERPIDDSLAAIAGADGRFTIPSAGKAFLIGARAEGYAPSDEKPLTRDTLPEVEVRLVLPGRGGAIEGRVVDPEGRPIEGASVVTDVGYRFEEYPGGGEQILNSLRLRASSASDGSFRFSGVQPNRIELRVYAPGHPVWTEEIEVAASATTHVEARVSVGGSVHGSTLGPDGTPLPGVLVVASIEASMKPLDPTGAWLEQDWNSLLRYATSDRYAATRSHVDGTYRLEGLPAGHSYLVAQTPGSGKVVAPLWVESGEALERDLVFERGLELCCQLVDEQGLPLVDQPVFVAHVGDEARGTTFGSRGLFRTDAEGHLVVPNCADAPYRLDIRQRDLDDRHVPCPEAAGLRPGPSEHRIVVANANPLLALVRGIVLDDTGQPLAGAYVFVKFTDGSSRRVAMSGEDGAFLSAGFEPGTWGLRVHAQDFPRVSMDPRAFASGETEDVGVIRLKTPGHLVARLARADGGPVDDDHVEVQLQASDGSLPGGIESELGEAHFDPIEPGSYTLRVQAWGCETVSVPVVIEAGMTREFDLVLRAAERAR